MSAVHGRRRALLRLLAVQGSWNYERMLGVGMGYAALPLLEDLKATDPSRHPEAVVRAAEYFNCNPNLAGLALGATVRAEYDGTPGEQILRLRTALCSPLGALGDQLFWIGLVPALVGAALVTVVLGAGWWPVVALLLVYNAIRLWTASWSLRAGLDAGVGVGAAIRRSWVSRAIGPVGLAAGLMVGVAIPLVADWFLRSLDPRAAAAVLVLAAAGVAISRWFGARVGAVRFALLAAGLILVVRWAIR